MCLSDESPAVLFAMACMEYGSYLWHAALIEMPGWGKERDLFHWGRGERIPLSLPKKTCPFQRWTRVPYLGGGGGGGIAEGTGNLLAVCVCCKFLLNFQLADAIPQYQLFHHPYPDICLRENLMHRFCQCSMSDWLSCLALKRSFPLNKIGYWLQWCLYGLSSKMTNIWFDRDCSGKQAGGLES